MEFDIFKFDEFDMEGVEYMHLQCDVMDQCMTMILQNSGMEELVLVNIYLSNGEQFDGVS